EIPTPAGHRRGDGDQRIRLQRRRAAQAHVGAKAEAGQPQWLARARRAHPFHHRTQVLALAVAVVEGPFGAAGAAEVEAHRGRTELAQRARHHGHDLVVHGPALGRQRVADHRHEAPRISGFRQVHGHFQGAGGAVQEQGGGLFGEGTGSHAPMIQTACHGPLLSPPGRPGDNAAPQRDGATMHFLLLSVTCSVLVSVLLKLAPRRGWDAGQMITWNYLAAALLAAWLLRPPAAALSQPGAPWASLLVLAVVLPGLFLVLA